LNTKNYFLVTSGQRITSSEICLA